MVAVSFSGLLNATLSLLASSNAVVGGEQSLSLLRAADHASNTAKIPTKTIGQDVFGHDVSIPLIGAGTWQYDDDTAYEALCKAFSVGYTFVDTAYGYRNQEGVGRAIKDCWFDQGKSREDLFVMTKIPGGLTASEALAAHDENLQLLGLHFVDHVMTHFPADWKVTPERSSKEARQAEWVALENMYYRGLTRSIGISHYCPTHIDDILEIATVNPSINQVEYHVGSGDVDGVIQKCKEAEITFMSFSPLCGPCEISNPKDSLINGELVTDIAKKYEGVTGSQVALRFIVQQALQDGIPIGPVIPKSNNIDHIRSNMDVFSFQLSPDDMDSLYSASQPSAEGGDCDVP